MEFPEGGRVSEPRTLGSVLGDVKAVPPSPAMMNALRWIYSGDAARWREEMRQRDYEVRKHYLVKPDSD